MNPEQWRDYKSALAQDLEQAEALPFNAYTTPSYTRQSNNIFFIPTGFLSAQPSSCNSLVTTVH
ncbi:MAG: hypothetical protein CM15mP120_29920 [Pseudomonadota bacterium]|nr:MAG: hypothetical protein CM15mP120_29920 [Pseudomonadota bacterium]